MRQAESSSSEMELHNELAETLLSIGSMLHGLEAIAGLPSVIQQRGVAGGLRRRLVGDAREQAERLYEAIQRQDNGGSGGRTRKRWQAEDDESGAARVHGRDVAILPEPKQKPAEGTFSCERLNRKEACSMAIDADLSKHYQALFDEYNRKYFRGRLPSYRIRVVERIPGRLGPAGIHQRTHTRILIRRSDNDDMIVTLLHEMAHAATVDNHNHRFRAELQRLRQAGAPIPDGELMLTSTRITKQFIESEAREFLLYDDRLNLTLRQFVRALVSQEGVADSQAALLRQYPWVSRVFRDAKKRACKDRQAMETFRERLQAGKEA